MPIVLARCLAARADLSVRVKLPVDVREVIGCVHVNRSLRTDGLSLAVRLARKVAFKIDAMFEATRRQIGFGYDERLIVDHDSVATVGTTIRRRSDPSFVAENSASIDQTELPMPTLSTIYGRFLDDPAKRRSARAMLAHHSTRRVVEDVLGPLTPISRSAARLAGRAPISCGGSPSMSQRSILAWRCAGQQSGPSWTSASRRLMRPTWTYTQTISVAGSRPGNQAGNAIETIIDLKLRGGSAIASLTLDELRTRSTSAQSSRM